MRSSDMSSTDKFEKFRVMAARWRSLISDSNTPEVNAALKDSADFMDKLIAQKEAEREKSRQSDIANLTAAVIGLTEVFIGQQTDMASLTSAITGLTEVITAQNERVSSAAPKAKSAASKKPEKINAEEYQHILNAYNDNCGSLPKVAKLTEKRRRAIRLCVEQGFSDDDFCAAFKKAASTPFLTGDNDRKWRANFDFIVKPDNLQRIIEGAYGSGQENSHSYNLDKIMDYYENNPPKFN